MGGSQYPYGQQADALPRQMYELPEEDPKAGLFKRLSIGLLISGVFVLLKDVLFNWGERTEARADSAPDTNAVIKNIGPPSLTLVETPEPIDQGDPGQRPNSIPDPNRSSSRPIDSFSSIDGLSSTEQPFFADPVQARSSSGISLASTNFNGSAPPAVGFDVNDLPPQFGSGIARSGRGSGRGGFGSAPVSGGNTGDPRLAGNRAPVATRPARLDSLLVDQTAVIVAAGLLQNITDADGDVLAIQNLAASSGNLVDAGAGFWLFTPDQSDTSEVIFTYNVTDGIESTPQTALLDLLPLPAETIPSADPPDTVIGAPSDDMIGAPSSDPAADALDGKSRINGDDGDNRILGSEGDDVIFGGAGDDVILGGDGDDTIFGGDGNDVILGQDGQDLVIAGAGNDVVIGGAGDDQIFGTIFDGDDTYFGGAGIDTYDLSGTEADAIVDLASRNANSSQTGNDRLSDIENVVGGTGDDTIVGSDDNNVIQGGPGSDKIDGGVGDDRFIATVFDGDDTYSGGAGTDTYDLSGTEADAIVDLASGTANSSQTGNDSLSSIENVVGGAGDDIFKASKVFNMFTGGEGNDIFEFGGILRVNGIGVARDQITDFQVGDRIDLAGFDAILTMAGNPDLELVVDKLEFLDSGKVEVRFQGFGEEEHTVVEVKIGDSADLVSEIELHGRHELTADDFIGVS